MVFIVHPHWLAANTIMLDCMYSKLPADDEEPIYSKHVEDIYWNELGKKVHRLGSYYANLHIKCIYLVS